MHFFAVETLNALAEQTGQLKKIRGAALPEKVAAKGVQQILMERIHRVPKEHLDVLKLAAVVGRQIDFEVMKTFSIQVTVEEWLFTSANYAILESRNQQWRFAHDRVRDVILEQLAENEKSILHKQVARALEDTYPKDDSIAVRLVEHWQQAGNTEREAYHALRAGKFVLKLGRMNDAQGFLGRGLQLVTLDDDPGLYGQFVQLQGDIEFRLGHYDEASTCHEEVLKIAQEIQDEQLELSAFNGLGNIAMYTDRLAAAERYYREALGLSHDETKSAELQANLGTLRREQGNYKASYDLTKEALSIFRRSNDQIRIATCLLNLASAAIGLGNESPIPYLKEVHDIYTTMGNIDGEARVLINLGNYSNKIGDFSAALHYLEECIASEGARSSLFVMWYALSNILDTIILSGRLTLADQYLEQFHIASLQSSSQKFLGKYHFKSGYYHFHRKAFDSANRHFFEAIEIHNQINDPVGKFEACVMMNAVAVAIDKYDMAYEYLGTAMGLAEDINTKEIFAIVFNHAGDLAIAESRFDDAFKDYERAFSNARESHYNVMVGHALLGFGKVLHALGYTNLAAQTLRYLIDHVPCSYWTIEEAKALLEQIGNDMPMENGEIIELDDLVQKIMEHEVN